MTQRVLVPYDSSEQADYALAHAVGAFTDAKIVLFHVIEPFADHTSAAGYDGARYKQRLETTEQMLESVADEYDADIETVAQYGRPVHWIVRYIEQNSIDHVVIGSHGRDGAKRLLLGSVAETVARRSPVPVTVVRKPPDGAELPETILVPFDASACARKALVYALEQFEDSEVTALYAAYPPVDGTREMDTVFNVLEDWDEVRADHVSSVLDVATEIADEHNRTIETLNVDGEPANAIIEQADDTGVNQIIMGSTGRDGLSRLLLGSVAEVIIRRAPVTVTVVK